MHHRYRLEEQRFCHTSEKPRWSHGNDNRRLPSKLTTIGHMLTLTTIYEGMYVLDNS